MKNRDIKLSSHESCTGCGACVAVCPKSCILMVKNHHGFMQPKINTDMCIDCTACGHTCPIINERSIRQNYVPKVYAAINNDNNIRHLSSSGGAFFALAEWVIRNDGVVFGAMFKGIHLQHSYADTLEGIYPFMGSKYVQSDVADSYSKVKAFLNEGRHVLYSGTPCQIAGLKHYLQKDYEKLITVDLICHGVPSPTIWERYMCRLLKKLHAQNVRDIRFRTKRENVKSPVNFYFFFFFLGLDGKWHEYGEDCRKNLYFSYFMRHLFRASCYNCRFRSLDKSEADFTIGDCWNVNEDHPEMSDGKGVSTIILHTKKAMRVISDLKDAFTLDAEDISIMQKRYAEAKQEELYEKERRLWKFSNRMAQIVPLEYMQFIYKHDRLDYILRRKINKLWQKSIK